MLRVGFGLLVVATVLITLRKQRPGVAQFPPYLHYHAVPP
jgi:hypothetical protein